MLSRMASDDAADLLLEIKQERRRPVLDLLPAAKQRKIKGLLGYNPSTAGGVMSPDFVTVAARRDGRAGARGGARPATSRPRALHAILLTDADGVLSGLVTAGQLICAGPEQTARRARREQPAAGGRRGRDPRGRAPDDRLQPGRRCRSSTPTAAPIGVVSVDDILELTLPEDWRRRYGLARE